jgi:hypothetical protein
VDAVGLIKVLMLVGLFTHGHIVGKRSYVVTILQCRMVQQNAEDYNNRFQLFWAKDNKDLKVLCLEYPGNQEA